MASPEAVEQARNTDIVAVAEHLGLELETRGAAMWALCPFHDERTASFSLNSERGLYKCFGCGAGWRRARRIVGVSGAGGASLGRLNAVQVTLEKALPSDPLGITLSDQDEHHRPSSMGDETADAEQTLAHLMTIPPPVVSMVGSGSLAEQSGAITVGQRLLAVNGVGVHGHEHGTRLLKLAHERLSNFLRVFSTEVGPPVIEDFLVVSVVAARPRSYRRQAGR